MSLAGLPTELLDVVVGTLSARDQARAACVSRDMRNRVRRLDALGALQDTMIGRMEAELRRFRELGEPKSRAALVAAVAADPALAPGCTEVDDTAVYVYADYLSATYATPADAAVQLIGIECGKFPMLLLYDYNAWTYTLVFDLAGEESNHVNSKFSLSFGTALDATALARTAYAMLPALMPALAKNQDCDGPFAVWWPGFSATIRAYAAFVRHAL